MLLSTTPRLPPPPPPPPKDSKSPGPAAAAGKRGRRPAGWRGCSKTFIRDGPVGQRSAAPSVEEGSAAQGGTRPNTPRPEGSKGRQPRGPGARQGRCACASRREPCEKRKKDGADNAAPEVVIARGQDAKTRSSLCRPRPAQEARSHIDRIIKRALVQLFLREPSGVSSRLFPLKERTPSDCRPDADRKNLLRQEAGVGGPPQPGQPAITRTPQQARIKGGGQVSKSSNAGLSGHNSRCKQ